MNIDKLLDYLKRGLIAFAIAFMIAFALAGLKNALAASAQFNRNLSYGLRGDTDVVRLQDMLHKLGFFNYNTSTGNYFAVTVEAVKKFQIANNIKPVSGYFGPLTRAEANRLAITIDNSPAIIPFVPVDRSATSTYWGKVKIIDSDRYSTDPRDEYLLVQNVATTTENIDITGFKLVNSTGEEFTIPKGFNLPGASAIPQDEIVLRQYDTAKIISGRQEKQMNFRENLCTGYFNQSSDYKGKLSTYCPRPDVRSSLNLPDHCIKVFEATPYCSTVDQAKIQVAECIAFSEAHFNYQGCVNDNKDKTDYSGKNTFYSNNWLVWMQRPDRFLRPIHDKVTLYDSKGKIVSVFTY